MGVIVLFALTILCFTLHRQFVNVAAVLAIIFGLAGIVLVVLTLRLQEPRFHRAFFLVTGISAAGIPISVVLHNLVYALCILCFGQGFWGNGSDEPFFFLLAIIVFPALFVVGAVGSSVLLVRSKVARTSSRSHPVDQ